MINLVNYILFTFLFEFKTNIKRGSLWRRYTTGGEDRAYIPDYGWRFPHVNELNGYCQGANLIWKNTFPLARRLNIQYLLDFLGPFSTIYGTTGHPFRSNKLRVRPVLFRRRGISRRSLSWRVRPRGRAYRRGRSGCSYSSTKKEDPFRLKMRLSDRLSLRKSSTNR